MADSNLSRTEAHEAAKPTVPTTPPAVESADFLHSVTQIDRAIKQRRNSDVEFMNFWLYFLVVAPVTFGIYALIIYYRRMTRIDRFSERKKQYYEAVMEWTERFAERNGRTDDVHFMLGDMRSEVQAAYRGDLRKINAGISFLLTIVSLGIYGFYVLYRVNRYWWDAQVLEEEFDDRLSQTWGKLGLMRYPLSLTPDQGTRRSYALYLILSIVTLGIWGVVWDYKTYTDPEKVYPEMHAIEDTVLQTVRQH